MVEDQEHALRFYTDILGFEKRKDFPAGGARFLTVAGSGNTEVELLLEPNSNPAVPARQYQQALYDAGIPAAAFASDDVHREYERLIALGVRFTGAPTTHDGVTIALLDDTCGNLIMIVTV
jgi:catechol 2,3-dioxygenase-like lactoylglutathione lyase family enzyme